MEALINIMARFQKTVKTTTVHVIIPRLLLALLISETKKRIEDPVELNRELHKFGVWVGSRCMASLAKKESLEKIHPEDQNPEDTARGMAIYAKLAWYIFAGHYPRVETKIIHLDKGFLIKGILKPDPKKDHVFKGIISLKGINPLYLASGAYEGATVFSFKVLRIENLWYSLWRPKQGEDGLVGFYIWHETPLEEAVKNIEKEEPGFFNAVKLEDSNKFLKEYLGVRFLI